MFINVMLDRVATPIDRGVFEALFEQSVVRSYAKVTSALETGSISFKDLVDHAHKGQIPYPLFFAPRGVVDAQLELNRSRLFEGFSKKREFFMNSRHHVDLAQVELIVKNLQFKQDLIKKDNALDRNGFVGIIKKSQATVAQDATKIMASLDLDPSALRGAKMKKGDALSLLVEKLETKNVLVAQSAQHHMPQDLPGGQIFSGMTVKDPKVPFIFIASGDEGEKYQPEGRRIFTLTLLAVLVARGRFSLMTYDGHTTEDNPHREYAITEEILMPEAEFRRVHVSDLDAMRSASDVFKVTPSAVVVRAMRLKLISRDDAEAYLDELREAFEKGGKQIRRGAKGMKAFHKFNGHECSRRMLAMHQSGSVSTDVFCRVMFSNKRRSEQAINDYRATLS